MLYYRLLTAKSMRVWLRSLHPSGLHAQALISQQIGAFV